MKPAEMRTIYSGAKSIDQVKEARESLMRFVEAFGRGEFSSFAIVAVNTAKNRGHAEMFAESSDLRDMRKGFGAVLLQIEKEMNDAG